MLIKSEACRPVIRVTYLNMICRFSAIAIMCMVVALPAQAAELKPLQELPGTAAPYIPTRCAALTQALMEWVGKDRIGSKDWSVMESGLVANLMMASNLSKKNGMDGSDEYIMNIILRDVRNIANLYIDRFKNNYAIQGEAFANDRVMILDMFFCKEVTENSYSKFEN